MWKPENARAAILKISLFLLQSANSLLNYSHICRNKGDQLCFRQKEFISHLESFIF